MDSEKKRELIGRLEALADFANGGDGVTIGDATQTCRDAIAVIRNTRPDAQADLVEALRECTDGLEDEINGRYPEYMLNYPHNVQTKKNDMEAVIKARAALEKVGVK